ncbi:MAG: peptide deformylase, partial [Proteobacteria bacterium]|nr:peptide deformylase [Pseudomonadota bacterium]
EARELQAVALLHEYAHLEGSVFIDRLNPVKRNMTKKFWVKRGKALAEETYKDTKLKYVFDEQAFK